MARENIPRWLTQPTPQVGSAVNQIRVVTPDDLQAASEMYGQVSNRMFNIAQDLAFNVRFLTPDYDALKSKEEYLNIVTELETLRNTPGAYTDGTSYIKAAQPIIDNAAKNFGFSERLMMRKLTNQQVAEHGLDIDRKRLHEITALTMKDKDSEWNVKQDKYLDNIDGTWDSKQFNEYVNQIKQERRGFLSYISEPQQQVLDNELDVKAKVYSVANEITQNNNYNDPKKLKNWKNSERVMSIMKDSKSKSMLDSVLNERIKKANADFDTRDKVEELRYTSAFNEFQTNFLAEKDPAKQKAMYDKELEKAREYGGIGYMKKLSDFSVQMGKISNGASKTFGVKDKEMYNKGLLGQHSLAEIEDNLMKGLITGDQAKDFEEGFKKRGKLFGDAQKRLTGTIKTEFGVDISRKPKNADRINDVLLSKQNPEKAELKKYILDEQAQLAAKKIENPLDFDKEVGEFLKRVRQKRVELDQRKQSQSGNNSIANQLINQYGSRK